MENLWTLVLAGGGGTRLATEAIRRYGYPRPKQFCDFDGRGTLLEQTLGRATRLCPEDRVAVVTTRTHRAEARTTLAAHPRALHVEQPRNRDTAPGLLLPLLRIFERDFDAIVAVMPSDHHVRRPAPFLRAIGRAARVVRDEASDKVVLLGAPAGPAAADCGWIVPGDPRPPGHTVARFREKPTDDEAARLSASGALVSTFVMVAHARTLCTLFGLWTPEWWAALAGRDDADVESAYAELPSTNFSRDVLEHATADLLLMPIGDVGWSDVGTPDRLRSALPTVVRRRPAPEPEPADLVR